MLILRISYRAKRGRKNRHLELKETVSEKEKTVELYFNLFKHTFTEDEIPFYRLFLNLHFGNFLREVKNFSGI